jgi:hypothetical protein
MSILLSPEAGIGLCAYHTLKERVRLKQASAQRLPRPNSLHPRESCTSNNQMASFERSPNRFGNMNWQTYTLHREKDGREWKIVANSPEMAVALLSEELKARMYICEGPGTHALTWGEPLAGGRQVAFGVVLGEPRFTATVYEIVDGYTLTLVCNDPIGLLLDRVVRSEKSALELLETTLRIHRIPSQDCQVKRIVHH